MNRSDAPAKQSKPFGINGQREPILPTTPAGDNTASYELGFPPITMILKSAGGLPPKGQDMNQILFELSSLARWTSSGSLNGFDSSFSTAIGGYPSGAFVLGNDLKTVYRCTTDGNTGDPNVTTTGWVKAASDVADILALGTAAYRNVGTGTNQLPDMSSFSSLASGNGYQQLPSGHIIQWGISATDSTSGLVSQPFPMVFPNTAYTVVIGPTNNQESVEFTTVTVASGRLNQGGFGATGYKFNTTTNIGSKSGISFYWIAIGK